MKKKRIGLVGAAAGAGAAGVGAAAMAARKYAVGRVRLRPDPDANEPLGELRGRVRTVRAGDGVPLHVEIDEATHGAVLTVVFCHGYALNQDSWHYQRRALRADGDLRLVFWDQRGHGRSGRGEASAATLETTGEDLYAVLRATVGPDEPVALVGHSMGGMTIMALAERHPELFGDQVVEVALINTSAGGLADVSFGLPAVFGRVFRIAAPGMVHGLAKRASLVDAARRLGADASFVLTRRFAFADKAVSPTVVDFLEQMTRSTPIDVIAEFYPSLMEHDRLAVLTALRPLPVLVVAGDTDRLTPLLHGAAIVEALPDAELVEVADGGHALVLEHPGIVTGALERLIDRARPVARGRTA